MEARIARYPTFHCNTAWLKHWLDQSSISWDITISKLLSIVLIVSLGCRGGDVARSQLYQGSQHVAFKDIDMRLMQNAEVKFEIWKLLSQYAMEKVKRMN
jgi:hypothetical protein